MNISRLTGLLICFITFVAKEDEACKNRKNKVPQTQPPPPTFEAVEVAFDKDAAERAHNAPRASKDVNAKAMQKVEWNGDLATFALEKAKTCGFIPEDRSYPNAHELGTVLLNADKQPESKATIPAMVKTWVSFGKFGDRGPVYKPDTGECPEGLIHDECESYKRMMRETITAVGCAMLKCVKKKPQTLSSHDAYRTLIKKQDRTLPSDDADQKIKEKAAKHTGTLENPYEGSSDLVSLFCAYAPEEEVEDDRYEKLNGRAYVTGTPGEDCGKYGRDWSEEERLCVKKT